MRVDVSVNSEWNVTIAIDRPRGWSRTVALRQVTHPDGEGVSYPLPPVPISGVWDLEDFDTIHEAHVRVRQGRPQPSDIGLFGRYLFETFLGEAAWAEVREAAGGSLVELALSWPCERADLHRLPWEMMSGPDGLLAEGGPMPVAIVRTVAGTSSVPISQVEPPSRVLFVVCAPLSDPKVRAGAEVMGLIRQFPDDTGGKRRGIRERFLLGSSKGQGVTPSELREEVRRFPPDVVHFIGHGDYDTVTGNGYVVMGRDAGESDGDVNRDARFLLSLLRHPGSAGQPGGALPKIVVLGTCYSAGARTGRLLDTVDTAPLAAELVAGGVPVVVGMGGKISDIRCRLFTRRFGAALIGKGSLAEATACGREAAPPATGLSSDWAYPTVFLAESVPAGFVPVSDGGGWAEMVERWIDGFKVNDEPVFCGREDVFEKFHRLFGAGEPVLAVRTPPVPQIGRTRLLHEMTAQILRDRNIPCLVSERNASAQTGPRSLGEFALVVVKAMQETRDVLGLDPPESCAVFEKLHDTGLIEAGQLPGAGPGRDDWYEALLVMVDGWLTSDDKAVKDKLKLVPRAVRRALQDDLAALADDARRRYPELKDSGARPVVLLDDLHHYDRQVFNDIAGKVLGAPGAFGLGPSSDERVPVIAVYAMKEGATDPFPDGIPGVIKASLDKFPEGAEHVLATGRLLLFPSRSMGESIPGYSGVAWALNSAADPDVVQLGDSLFYLATDDGLPGNFGGRRFYATVKRTEGTKYLVRADDDKILVAFADRIKVKGRVGAPP